MPRSVLWLATALALFTTGNALVLSVAVLIGSQLADDPFAGTFWALSIVYVLAFVLLLYLPLKPQHTLRVTDAPPNRSYRQLYSQPLLILIAVVSVVGYIKPARH